MLEPPVELVRPVKVASLPNPPAGSMLWQVKLDGWRCAAFVSGAGAVLQARSGRDVTARFPEVVWPLSALPPGTVLDGEVVALVDGVFDFGALSRSPGWRRDHNVSVAYQAFDLLADGGEDLRGLPLADRWAALLDVLGQSPGGVQPVLSTLDRTEALRWIGALQEVGIEGIVGKPMRRPYNPTAGWIKLRHSDTFDADVLGVLGTTRPRALRVRLDDGREAVTEPLSSVAARAVKAALAERGLPLRVEVRAGMGRHAQVRFVRVRPPD